METRYYTAHTILKEALCDNCGKMLRYVKSDFSRKDFCWLHWCEKCNKKYWLNNRYPLVDYLVDPNNVCCVSLGDGSLPAKHALSVSIYFIDWSLTFPTNSSAESRKLYNRIKKLIK